MSPAFEIPTLRCPACQAAIPVAEPLNDGTVPTEGALSICAECTAVSVFNHGATSLRPPTDEEQAEFDRSDQVQSVLLALRSIKDLKGFK